MRVITGSAKGRKLETLKGEDVIRPTSDKIKESMFSAIQFYIAGAKVLDLFAGSGQLGIEALSRDASVCTFVDISREACDVIKTNLKKTELFDKARVITGDAERYVTNTKDDYDIVFIDPPYGYGTVDKFLNLIEPHMTDNGFVVCETESNCEPVVQAGALEFQKSYRHGKTMVWIYKKFPEVTI